MSDQHNTPPNSDDRPAQQPANRTLSEISHLFLSSIREKQAGGSATGSARPQRVPPKRAEEAPKPVEPALDLTPEEFAEVFGDTSTDHHVAPNQPAARTEQAEPSNASAERMPPVHAMIVQHLNGHAVDRVREYAAHLCKSGERVGVISVDACEFTLTSFERGTAHDLTESHPIDQLDGRRMNEALEEMNWDVDRWLLHVANPRANEARALLRQVDRWTVLATCDHDGVVSCYRTLKGLADLHVSDSHHRVPTLSLSLLDADDEMVAMRVFRKLSGVCQQFLKWPLESEEPTQAAGSVAEHVVLSCRATRDKAQLATAPQWNVVGDFLSRCRATGTRTCTSTSQPTGPQRTDDDGCIPVEQQAPQTTINPTPVAARPDPVARRPASEGTMTLVQDGFNDVIELPAGGDGSIATIVSATVRGASELVELPIKPPMLAEASLAVTRERRLVLLAVARQGLSDLRAVGEAYRWMNENRVLIAMAVPQLSIDAHQLPHLRLLVDRADLSAATLQPLLQSANVTVNTYRKLRWGPKTGLLLEAA